MLKLRLEIGADWMTLVLPSSESAAPLLDLVLMPLEPRFDFVENAPFPALVAGLDIRIRQSLLAAALACS